MTCINYCPLPRQHMGGGKGNHDLNAARQPDVHDTRRVLKTMPSQNPGGAGEAESAERSARALHEKIPGAWPERKGIDPELYDDIPNEPRDPKIDDNKP
jgi:hypothetical protein